MTIYVTYKLRSYFILRDTCFLTEHRFHDAGYYFWKLSVQCLDLVSDGATSGTSRKEPIRTRKNTKLVPSAGNHVTGCKRGKFGAADWFERTYDEL